MFSTLDPVTRRIVTPMGREALLTDTVGFIQKLPPAVVAAFRATLEEVQAASLILHVQDITHPNAAEQANVVEGILNDLGVSDKPRILALNKIDLLDAGDEYELAIQGHRSADDGSRVVFTSARTGSGLRQLLDEIDATLSADVDLATLSGSPLEIYGEAYGARG